MTRLFFVVPCIRRFFFVFWGRASDPPRDGFSRSSHPPLRRVSPHSPRSSSGRTASHVTRIVVQRGLFWKFEKGTRESVAPFFRKLRACSTLFCAIFICFFCYCYRRAYLLLISFAEELFENSLAKCAIIRRKYFTVWGYMLLHWIFLCEYMV